MIYTERYIQSNNPFNSGERSLTIYMGDFLVLVQLVRIVISKVLILNIFYLSGHLTSLAASSSDSSGDTLSLRCFNTFTVPEPAITLCVNLFPFNWRFCR